MLYVNKKEEFIKTLMTLTDKDKVKWEALPTYKHQDLIFNSDHNVRLFKCELGGKTILLTEKKIPEYFTDYDTHFEVSKIEIYVTSEVGIEFVIDEDVAAKDTLYDFINSVAEKSNKTDSFIDDVISMTS